MLYGKIKFGSQQIQTLVFVNIITKIGIITKDFYTVETNWLWSAVGWNVNITLCL